MRTLLIGTILTVVSFTTSAQHLTPAQKNADFQYLASLYSTYYAPLDWKKQLTGFDALNVKPWLDRVAKTTTDLDFYELCVEYVAALQDTHDAFTLPTDFVARLGFSGDIYDGVYLIDSINRTTLPLRDYPFVVGDELLSVDGREVAALLKDFAKYAPQGNARSTQRLAAARITIRPQSVMPHASELGESATVVIRRQSGEVETYTIPWTKTGTPLEVGPVPSPKTTKAAAAKRNPALIAGEPEYMSELRTLQFSGVIAPETLGLNGYGSRSPIFISGLGTNFTRRLGGSSADFFYSGTFKFDDLVIGYIRIPNYSPPSQATAFQQFEREIAYMNANTDGLIIDEMRNTGGNLCFGESLAARLIPNQFHATGFEIRAYWARVMSFYNALVSAKANGAPQEIIDQYELLYQQMRDANLASRGITAALPLCSSSLDRDTVRDRDGNSIAYLKPIIVLTDEFSTSTADSFAGMMQDSRRALLYGMRTNGAGGNNTSFDAGPYSEGVVGMTLALQARKDYVGTLGYPTTKYIENVGVGPNIPVDYMTKENLLKNGAPFIDGFLQSMAAYIRQLR